MPDPIHASWRAVVLALGILFLAAGLFWPLFSCYLGRLPGDIVVPPRGLDDRLSDHVVPAALLASLPAGLALPPLGVSSQQAVHARSDPLSRRERVGVRGANDGA
jgi:hypothetical protein